MTSSTSPGLSDMDSLSICQGMLDQLQDGFVNARKDVKSLREDNVSLRSVIEGLKHELEVFKNAHRHSMKEIDTLKAKETHVKNGLNSNAQIVCLIDGDGVIFSREYLVAGREGGKQAAKALLDVITVQPELDSPSNIWVYMFLNKRGLLHALELNNVCSASAFDEFTLGFNEAMPRFLLADVGGGKEAADARIKVYFEEHIRSPLTTKIVFGGCHDNGYGSILRQAETLGKSNRLVLLPGYDELAREIQAMQLPMLNTTGLFMRSKLPSNHPVIPLIPPASPTSYKSAVQTPSSDHIFTAFPDSLSAKPQSASPKKSVQPGQKRSPGKPLLKHDPPPCTMFYLADCNNNQCRYGHHYILEEDDYKELHDNAKRVPCDFANDNQECPWGEGCVYGHKCPHGEKCFYLRLGKCKFERACIVLMLEFYRYSHYCKSMSVEICVNERMAVNCDNALRIALLAVMALPLPLQRSMLPTELELIASETTTEIIPLFAMKRFRLVSGPCGPFTPPRPAKVPLWLACNLKLKKKCRLLPPDWLSVEYLQRALNDETSDGPYSVLPFQYVEIAKVFLDVAPDDVPNVDRIRSLLKDLREAREAKTRAGLNALNAVQLSLSNLCAMEINEVRPFFVGAMNVMSQLAVEGPSITSDTTNTNNGIVEVPY